MRTHIGTFMQDQHGLMHGKIYGLGLGVTSVMFEPQFGKDGEVSYFKLLADPTKETFEVGRAWEKEKDGMVYYSVLLESPLFPNPLNLALFPDKDNQSVFNLILDRANRDQKADTKTGTKMTNRRHAGTDMRLQESNV